MKLIYILVTYTVFSQPSTNIFLYDLEFGNGVYKTHNKKNITPHNSYNNQPSFSIDGNAIFYTSMRDKKQTDIFKYDVTNNKDEQLTYTQTSEYSPLQTPDGKHFSAVVVEEDNAQRLWKYNLDNKKGERLMMTDRIGYHCWLDEDNVAIFQLTKPFSIKFVNIETEKELFISENIGRSLFYNVKEDEFNFINKAENETFIKSVSKSGKILDKKFSINNLATDFFVSSEGHYFVGVDNQLLSYLPELKKWEIVEGINLDKISRIAVSPNSKKIAIVSEI